MSQIACNRLETVAGIGEILRGVQQLNGFSAAATNWRLACVSLWEYPSYGVDSFL